MANHSKSNNKPRNPQPKSTNQAQNNEPNAEEGDTHTSSKEQPTSDNGQPTITAEPPRRGRGRPKRTAVQQSGSMGQEPTQTEVVAPRKRARKAATPADDDNGSQPPPKRTKKGMVKAKLLEPMSDSETQMHLPPEIRFQIALDAMFILWGSNEKDAPQRRLRPSGRRNKRPLRRKFVN